MVNEFFITIDRDQLQPLLKSIESANLRSRGEWDCVSFFIEPSKSQSLVDIIVGNENQVQQSTLSIDNVPFRKAFSFSVPAPYLLECSRQKKPGESLTLSVSKENERYTIDVTEIEKLRECVSNPPSKEHEKYREKMKNLSFISVQKTKLDRLLYEIDNYAPLNFVEVKSDNNELKIQRKEIVEYYALPEQVSFPFDLTLNTTSLSDLKMLSQKTNAKNIEIIMHDEEVSFRAGDIVITNSLVGVDSFKQREAQKHEAELTMVIDFYSFKKEIDAYLKYYRDIKLANTNYLLVDNKELTVCAYTERYHHASPVSVHDISGTDETRLYQIDLSEIKNVLITDLSGADKMKVKVLKNELGERKLGFYNTRNPHHPYASIKVDSLPHELPVILAAKQRLQIKEKTNKARTAHETMNEDLFGFDDI